MIIRKNTIFSGTHKSAAVWKEFLRCMSEGLSLDKTAERCGITHATAFVWRHKVLDAIGDALKDTELTGIVEADEAFLPVSYKGDRKAFDGGGMSLSTTLKPVAGTVGGVTLQDGATLDLSEFDGSFSLDDNAVSFADGATIYVTTGSRTIAKRTPVISWTTPPDNLEGLTFMMHEDGVWRNMFVQDDGIYPPKNGLIIMFR